MDTNQGNKSKETDPGKSKKPIPETGEENIESQSIIPSDLIIAEKDEVKNAEERLRLKKGDEARRKK